MNFLKKLNYNSINMSVMMIILCLLVASNAVLFVMFNKAVDYNSRILNAMTESRLFSKLQNINDIGNNNASAFSRRGENINTNVAANKLMDAYGKYYWTPFYWSSPFKDPSSSPSSSPSLEPQVCLATHTSIKGLHWLIDQATVWNGPISAAVYVPGADLELLDIMIQYFKRCFPQVLSHISFHIAYPTDNINNNSNRIINMTKLDCKDPRLVNNYLSSLQSVSLEGKHVYPQNFLRNVARRSCSTKYAVVVDVDMIAVPKMAESLNYFLKSKNCSKCTYIIPVYEIHDNVNRFPNDKTELLKLISKKQARVFHSKKYSRNQGNSNLDEWQKYPLDIKTDGGNPIYKTAYEVISYQEEWEPIVIMPSNAPGFDERFHGYGFTRNSHIFLLHALKYRFMMLDLPFLSHEGFQDSKTSKWRVLQQSRNYSKYLRFKKEVMVGIPVTAN